MLCYVMLCYVMLCYVMLRYVMLWNETENIGTTWNNTAFDGNTKSQANPVLLQRVLYNPVYPIPSLSCLNPLHSDLAEVYSSSFRDSL